MPPAHGAAIGRPVAPAPPKQKTTHLCAQTLRTRAHKRCAAMFVRRFCAHKRVVAHHLCAQVLRLAAPKRRVCALASRLCALFQSGIGIFD